MPNDAKLGLVVGLALVLVIGVVFYRKDSNTNIVSPEAISAGPAAPTPAVKENSTPPVSMPETQSENPTVSDQTNPPVPLPPANDPDKEKSAIRNYNRIFPNHCGKKIYQKNNQSFTWN